jgi:hypothetical protein
VEFAVVVPCTDNKVGDGPGVALRELDSHLPPDHLASEWVDRIAAAPSLVSARELYKGPGWSASLNLVATLEATGAMVRWRILSAGYGLLHPDQPTTCYSATFMAGHADSIPGAADGPAATSRWWRLINELGGQSEPLMKLAGQVDGLVVAASAAYVDAIGHELVEAAQRVPMVIFCAGRPRVPEVAALVPRFDRRLREGHDPFVGGGDVGFNQRVAARCVELLGAGVVDRTRVDEVLAVAMDREGPVRHEREVASDATVLAFIDAALTVDPSASRTALLRRWRDRGRACEQGRFGVLYERVVAERDGQLTLGEAACG